MSSFANVSSRWSITRPLTLPGASGLKIVGRPRVEIANPFWQRLCRTLYADVRGIRAVSAIVSALPYPWATSAMYPRDSYPERPIDSSVFVARSNSSSRSTPPASSFDKSCGTTGPRYSMAVFIFSKGSRCELVKFEASLYRETLSFGVHGLTAPGAARRRGGPARALEPLPPRGWTESLGPHGRDHGLRAIRHVGSEWWGPRDVDPHRGESSGPACENLAHVRRVPDDSSRVLVPRPIDRGESGRCPRIRGRRPVHGSPGERPRASGWCRGDARAVYGALSLRSPGEECRRPRPWL